MNNNTAQIITTFAVLSLMAIAASNIAIAKDRRMHSCSTDRANPQILAGVPRISDAALEFLKYYPDAGKPRVRVVSSSRGDVFRVSAQTWNHRTKYTELVRCYMTGEDWKLRKQ